MIKITELLKQTNKQLAMHALLSERQHSPIKFHALTDIKVAAQKSQMAFHMYMGITTNCGNFFKRWEYQTTLPAS